MSYMGYKMSKEKTLQGCKFRLGSEDAGHGINILLDELDIIRVSMPCRYGNNVTRHTITQDQRDEIARVIVEYLSNHKWPAGL